MRNKLGRTVVRTGGEEYVLPEIKLERGETKVSDIATRVKASMDSAFVGRNVHVHIDADMTVHLCVNPITRSAPFWPEWWKYNPGNVGVLRGR